MRARIALTVLARSLRQAAQRPQPRPGAPRPDNASPREVPLWPEARGCVCDLQK